MKRFIIFTIALIASATQLFAQPQQRPHQEHISGNIQEFQTQLIIKQLEIPEAKQSSFTTLYTQYFEAMEQLRPKRQRPQRGEGERGEVENNKMTDSEIEAQILESFDAAEKVTTLKREYYKKFKMILSPQQILKMYNIERQFSERLNSELQNRAGGGRGERQREN